MKRFLPLIFTILLISNNLHSQDFSFLVGKWRIAGTEVYEEWQTYSDGEIRGISYETQSGKTQINEYLTLKVAKNRTYYEALVNSQNNGRPIQFDLIHKDTAYVFENAKHDFPKMIVYKLLNDSTLKVCLSGENNNITLILERVIQNTDTPQFDNPNYDAALAQRLGADDYGMKSYFFVILTSGSRESSDKELRANAFRGHLDNITRLVDSGFIVVAGPYMKNELNYRGLFIFDKAESKEEVEQLLKTDPAIKEGFLSYIILPWYGSAALPLYLNDADKIWRQQP